VLVIPDQCDYLEHVKALIVFIRSLGNVPVRINAFHAQGFTVRRPAGVVQRPPILNRWRWRWKNSRSL
jgi:pyruvate-formate lyase-activating enzyme